jgi:hypothetical protein
MLLIHDGRLEARGSSLPLFSALPRLSRVGRLFGCVLEAAVWGEGVVGSAGSVFCLGCDSEGGVTCEGAVFLVVSGEGWCGRDWLGELPLVSAGGLVSFGVEGVADGCLRSWFSAGLSVCLQLSDGAARGREPVV